MALSIGVSLDELAATTTTSSTDALAAVDAFTAAFGLPTSTSVATLLNVFPDADTMTGLVTRGIMPMIWATPSSATARKWTNWTAGLNDAAIDAWCQGYRQWIASPAMIGLPITLIYRFAQEMNATFQPWNSNASNANGNTVAGWIAAWKHLHDRIRVVNGLTEIGLFYCPWTVPSNLSHSITSMFPGVAYTQYIGADAYSSSNSGHTGPWANVPSMRAMVNQGYAEIAALDPDLPVILGETGVEQGDHTTYTATDAQRTSWVTGTGWGGDGAAGGYAWVAANTRIRLINYFDISGSNWQYTPTTFPLMQAATATAMATYDTALTSTTARQPLYTRSAPLSFG